MRRLRTVSAATVMLITCTALGCAPAGAAPATGAQALDSPTAEARISDRLAKRLANPKLGSDVSVVVLDANTNRVVFADDADKSMLPASNMKIVTAITTLAALGAETMFHTRTFAGPTPGSVILQGGGDPLLSSKDLRTLADRTAPALDRTVPVVVQPDTSLFAPATSGPGWKKDYIPIVAAPVTALARVGDYTRDPIGGAVHQFAKQLRTLGFDVTVGPSATPAEGAAPLAEIADHSVRDAIHLMLRDSENNVAEVLYRQVAIAKGQPATWDGARTAAMATLSELGIDTTGMTLADGSGVSRRDRLTTLSLANLVRLARVGDPARFNAMFDEKALPISGVTGTLDDAYGRFTTKQARCAKGAIRAKTGTLFDTIGLSGLTTATDGQEKVFSILVNHRPQRVARLATRQAVDGLAATVNGCW